MSERMKTLYLWLLECRDVKMPWLTRLFTFYAESQEEAGSASIHSRVASNYLILREHKSLFQAIINVV